ncbi:MAG: CoA-binding protein [Verrucomicrobiae bacterium]|nr:CoA-binding protein [Verrucomicrobiae bacterium]NNJ86074.1 CoA-binding protein [Akkermansiaceae bacterium]
MNKTTIIIGASPKPDRYANMAQKALTDAGHTVIPYRPKDGIIDGLEVVTSLAQIDQPVDTVTVYVRPSIFSTLLDQICDLKPARVILNPGTEDEEIISRLESAGIQAVEACTLVMLKTGQY